jgi:hypothetical protein
MNRGSLKPIFTSVFETTLAMQSCRIGVVSYALPDTVCVGNSTYLSHYQKKIKNTDIVAS